MSADISYEMTIEEIHDSLSNTSVTLSGMFWEVPIEKILERKDGDKWCPLEILIHMRQVAEVYAGRVNRMLKADEPPFMHDFDEEKQMSKIKFVDESVKSNLQSFMIARADLLKSISLLKKEVWTDKKAIHEVRGLVNLQQLLIPLAKREIQNIDKLSKYLTP